MRMRPAPRAARTAISRCRAAGEQEVGDVCAGDGQQQADGGEHDPDEGGETAGEGLGEGFQFDAELGRVGAREAAGEFGENGAEGGFGLLGGQPPRAAGDDVDDADAFGGRAGEVVKRKIDVGAAEHEPGAHDADDGARAAVEDHGAADGAGVAAEAGGPVAVAEDGEGLGIGVGGGDAHDVEAIVGDVVSAESAGLAGGVAPEDVGDGGGGDAFEDLGVAGEVGELFDGIEGAPAFLIGAADSDAGEIIDVFVGEGVEDDAVENAVHRRGGEDAQGEREQRGERERLVARQLAGTEF
jgi:hypothetical protein